MSSSTKFGAWSPIVMVRLSAFSHMPSPWKQSLTCAYFPKVFLMIRSMNLYFTGSDTSLTLSQLSLHFPAATLANLFWLQWSWYFNGEGISFPEVVKITEYLKSGFVCLFLIWTSLPLNSLINEDTQIKQP